MRARYQQDGSALRLEEYQRIRYATATLLRALNNCPYCGFEEHQHGDDCAVLNLVNAVEEPYLDHINGRAALPPSAPPVAHRENRGWWR